MHISSELRINDEIRAREIRVVDETGQQLGVMTVREGIRIANERGLDLVEVSPNARPAVCKIMDYGKHKYDQSKRDKVAKKRQRVINTKEVRMSPKIDEHDFTTKVRATEKFLKAGDKVKVSVRFRGREIVHTSLAKDRLLELADQVKDYGALERQPKLEGRSMIVFLLPKAENTKAEAKKEKTVENSQAAQPSTVDTN